MTTLNISALIRIDLSSFFKDVTWGRIVNSRSVNAWTTWKNSAGQTMDEVMRRAE